MDGTDGGRQRAALLLRKAKDGNESAAAELVHTLGPYVINCLRKKFDVVILEDAFNRTLFKFIRRPELYDAAKGCLRQLLTTAVSNAASDMCRKEKCRHDVENANPGGLEDIATVVPFYDPVALREESDELRKKLKAIWSSANPLERDLIDLVLDDEMNGSWAKELAERYGTSPNTVSACWRRLRKRIQTA